MEHVREVRQEVYEDADAPEIFEDMGIDVRLGDAQFLDSHTVSITHDDGTTTQASGRYIIIATGASALVPPIEGLDTVEYLTNDSLFEINDQPEQMAIVGAGPIGSEMAQAFTRLGTDVTTTTRSWPACSRTCWKRRASAIASRRA
jgi:pyruvate/2-oxoglutarate dehydrogenase complex dihydrolipoamide dehydrogenase (E3) component